MASTEGGISKFREQLGITEKATVGFGAKLTGVLKNIGGAVVNAAISWAITMAANAVITGIQNIVHFAENKAQELQEKISKRDSDQAELEKLTEELESQQKELTELQNTTGILNTYDQERLETL